MYSFHSLSLEELQKVRAGLNKIAEDLDLALAPALRVGQPERSYDEPKTAASELRAVAREIVFHSARPLREADAQAQRMIEMLEEQERARDARERRMLY